MAEPVVSLPETTAALAYDATPAQVETALEALTSITGVTVLGAVGRYFIIFDTAPQAGTDVVPLAPTNNLTGGTTPRVEVIERQRGQTGINAIQEVRIDGTPTGGTFNLSYQTITTELTELQVAMLWVDTVLRNSTPITRLIQPWQGGGYNPTYLAPDRLPFLGANIVPGVTVEIVPANWITGIVYAQAQSADYAPRTSGERVWSTVHLAIEMQSKAGRYDPRLQAGGLQIDNLFNQQKEQVVSAGGTVYGTIRASDRVSEINTSAVDSSGKTIYRKGGVFEIDVEKE